MKIIKSWSQMAFDENIHNLFNKIGKTVQDISYLGKGEASTVFKVQTDDGVYALKTALYPKRMKKVLQEVEIRKFFIDKGLNFIPPPIYSDKHFFPSGAAIYEFIEGKKPNFNDYEIMKQFALILSRIHKIDYQIIEDGFSSIEKLFSTTNQTINMIITKYSHLMNESILSAFECALQEFKDSISQEKKHEMIAITAQIHGDLTNNFVIDTNNKIWLIDWENSEYGNIAEEICWFLQMNDISVDGRTILFQEYQKQFPFANRINFEAIYPFFFAANLLANIYWGIDILAINIQNKLEPERKLHDLAICAQEWNQFFSEKTTNLIIEGIKMLTASLKS